MPAVEQKKKRSQIIKKKRWNIARSNRKGICCQTQPKEERTEKGSAAAKRALSPRSLAALTIFIDFVILAIFFVPTIRARTNQIDKPKQTVMTTTKSQTS